MIRNNLYIRKTRFVLGIVLAMCAISVLSSCEEVESNKKERNAIKEGNEFYNDSNYTEARGLYETALEYSPNSEIAKYNRALAAIQDETADSTLRAESMEMLRELYNSSSNMELAESALYNRSNFMVYIGDMIKAETDSLADIQLATKLNSQADSCYMDAIEGYKELLRRKPGDLKVTQNLRLTQLRLPPKQEDNQGGGGNDNQDNNQDQNNQQNQDENEQNQQDNSNKDNQQQQQQQQQQQSMPENHDDLLKALKNRESDTRNKRKEPAVPVAPINDKPW